MTELAHYQRSQTYDWNYRHAPEPRPGDAARSVVPGDWTFCGRPVPSPLGISAGPLLNGRWVLYYASLGFDILTYKTVRSQARESYPLPNLTPVKVQALTAFDTLEATEDMRESWAISFGMPSKSPECWREDVAWTRQRLDADKLLSVSVVATPQPDWTLAQVAADYATCARWAAESGADCIELNFSCPNVTSCDGQLFQNTQHAAVVAAAARQAIPQTPLIIKIGYMPEPEPAAALLRALEPFADALSMTNCIAARVRDKGQYLFGGESRGIGGDAIFASSLAQVSMFAELVGQTNSSVRIIGVGGISTAQRALDYLHAGAESVQLATAAMLDPLIAASTKAALSSPNTPPQGKPRIVS